MDLESVYRECKAYLSGHFLLSSGKHSGFYLQSAKVLEDPLLAERLCKELALVVQKYGLDFHSVCSPALGGVLVGYEFARACKKRFIFTERLEGKMALRRGFEVKSKERFIICEDIITTGGSALESAKILEDLGGEVVGFVALASRGFCGVKNLSVSSKAGAKLPENLPLFALGNFDFELYDERVCPFCKKGSKAVKPGSRGN